MSRKLLGLLLLSLLPLALFFFVSPARASTIITVNSTLDVIANDAKCTLREAIIAVNTQTGGTGGECPAGTGNDTINLPAGTYTITIPGAGEDAGLTGDFDITRTVTIIGAGPSTIIKQSTNDRIFEIFSPAQVALVGMQLQQGNETSGNGGGAIFNHGTLVLSNVVVTTNQSASGGGGLKNDTGASATLDTVSFLNNSAAASGGGIVNLGAMTVTRSIFTSNAAPTSNGGGLYNSGAITVTNATFISNTAGSNGGNIHITSPAVVMLNQVTVAQGSASLKGGGIMNNTGVVTIMNSALYSNTSAGSGGGIWNDGNVTLINATLSGNSAISGTVGNGGGIWSGGYVTMTNSTVASNSASLSGGGIFRDGSAGPFILKSTILAQESFTGGNCSGTFTSSGYNMDDGFSCGLGGGTGDLSSTDPQILSLSDYGGLVYTHALPPTSPAINRIPFGTNGCGTTITTDARGYARIAPCDVGAFEYVLRLFLPLIKR